MQSSRPVHHRQSLRRFCVLLGISLFVLASALSAQSEGTRAFNIPADVAEKTLKLFSEQSGRGLIMNADTVGAVRTNAVQGDLKPADALTRMLANTPLVATEDRKSGSYVVKLAKTPAPAEKNALSRPASDRAAADAQDGVLKLDTFEVMGTKLLNMDIRRTRDDAQPYVVFERERIEQSGATTVEEFLKNRLTMNTQDLSNGVFAGASGNASQLNLRGLGQSNTLILIDGHRAPARPLAGGPLQPDLNGIPLAAIERIEVLPTTASGIYGGGATGGVINVILRRDYAGTELKLGYENTFDGDAATRRVDLSAGFTFGQGRTNVLLAATWANSHVLTFGDRDFFQDGRARILANNPEFLLNAATPPLGATTNIRAVGGVNLTLKNGTALNSPFTYAPVGYAGAAPDGGAALVANAGQYNFALADSAQAGGARRTLMAGPTVEAVNLTVRRQFTPWMQAFVELAANDNLTEAAPTSNLTGTYTLPAAAATNPFNQAVNITVPLTAGDSDYRMSSRTRRALGGVIFKLAHDWMAEADFTYARSRSSDSPALALHPLRPDITAVSAGTLDLLRDTRGALPDFGAYLLSGGVRSPQTYTLRDATLRVSGPVLALPAGSLRISILAEDRREAMSEATLTQPPPAVSVYYPDRSQSVRSGYIEAQVPVLGGEFRPLGVEELGLQFAARRDDYTVQGVTAAIIAGSATPILRATNKTSSTDPTVGLHFKPTKDVMLRFSYGTGFIPPAVTQLIVTPATLTAGAGIDPRRGNSPTIAMTQLVGGNPNLKPEQSESWSGGVVLTPRFAANLRLAADYTRIEKSDNIANIALQTLINNEAILGSRITRDTVPAGDPFSVGPIIAVDLTSVNLSKAMVEAYDVALDYTLPTASLGTFDFYGQATWQTHYRTQLIATAPVVENIGISSRNPLKFKGNAGFGWRFGRWKAGWSVHYFDSYYAVDPSAPASAPVILNQGGARVGSQVYHDSFVSYRFGAGAAGAGFVGLFLRNVEVQAGLKNVFDQSPPFDAAQAATGYYSLFGDPRLQSFNLSVKKTF